MDVAPRYGLIADRWRRVSRVPQVLLEDVLLHLHRGGKPSVTANELSREFVGKPLTARRALLALEDSGFLQTLPDRSWQMTEKGQVEASRLVRAHRLWETYLQRVGIPVDVVHDTASRLEHVHDPTAVGYLDDKLGHPLLDPHGSEIPIAPGSHATGVQLPASELRPGYIAQVVGWSGDADTTSPLPLDRQVTAQPRGDDGQVWVFEDRSGHRYECDHDSADRVTLRIVGAESEATQSP